MEYLNNCYFDPINNNYPVTLENIRSQYPSVSFPTIINDEFIFNFLGLVKVVKTTKPSVTSLSHSVIEEKPIKDGQHYKQVWIVVNENLTPEQQAAKLEKIKYDKLSSLAFVRYMIETDGITVSGNAVKTDRESQAQLASAVLSINHGFTNMINWKGNDGWTHLNKEQIIQFGKIVSQHVQGCFNIEQMHSKNIQKLTTLTEVESYDIKTAWPSPQY